MTDSELDSIYGELANALTEIGESRAPLLLARFALLAIGEIDDRERIRALLKSARELEAHGGANGMPDRAAD
jgi:hypothetical protein